MQSCDDYRGWLQSMYILFGTKWSKLFCGPLWSNEQTGQSLEDGPNGVQEALDPLTVCDILSSPYKSVEYAIILGTSKCTSSY